MWSTLHIWKTLRGVWGVLWMCRTVYWIVYFVFVAETWKLSSSARHKFLMSDSIVPCTSSYCSFVIAPKSNKECHFCNWSIHSEWMHANSTSRWCNQHAESGSWCAKHMAADWVLVHASWWWMMWWWIRWYWWNFRCGRLRKALFGWLSDWLCLPSSIMSAHALFCSAEYLLSSTLVWGY